MRESGMGFTRIQEAVISEMAQRLLAAERDRKPIPPLTAQLPDLTPEVAYRIQTAVIRSKEAQGALVVGKKIGLTSKAMQQMLGVDQPDYGQILDNMMVLEREAFPVASLIQPRVEAEIAFVLGENLEGSGVSAARVLSATRWVMPALEIIDSRIENWKITLADTIADNASSARVVLGGRALSPDSLDLRLVGMVLEKNGEVVSTGAGAAVLGNPASAVAWLANQLARFGASLRAGDIVMPGALTAAVDVKAGDTVQATFDHLGSVAVRFV